MMQLSEEHKMIREMVRKVALARMISGLGADCRQRQRGITKTRACMRRFTRVKTLVSGLMRSNPRLDNAEQA